MKNLVYISQDALYESIQLNLPSEIDIKYYSISDECGYWVVKNLFKNFNLFADISKLSPVFNSNEEYNLNCFFKQKLPSSQLTNIKNFLMNFIEDKINYQINNLFFSDYGNIIKHGNVKCQKQSILPHSDGELILNSKNIIASNIWLSEGYNGSTAFWKYKNNYYGNEEYIKYTNNFSKQLIDYDNYKGDSFLEKIGECPSEYGTITLYNPNLLHSPVINKNHDHVRWSYVLIAIDLLNL